MLRLLTIAYLFLNVSLYAQVKISDLPAAGAVSGTEVFPIVQSATTKKLPVDSVRFWKQNGSGEIYRMSNVGIGTTTPVAKLHVEGNGVFYLGDAEQFYLVGDTVQVAVTADGINMSRNNGDTTLYNQTDTLIETTVIRQDGSRSAIEHDGAHMELTVTDGADSVNYIYHAHAAGGEGWIWEKANIAPQDSIIFQIKGDTRQIQYYKDPCAGCILADDGAGLGLLSYDSSIIVSGDSSVRIPRFAGSAQKLVTANATGVLDTMGVASISPWISLNDSVVALVYNGDTIKIGFISGLSLVFTNDLLLGNTNYNIVIENNNDGVQFTTNGTMMGRFTNTTGATQTGLYLYDADNNFLERVTVGAADSGGAGFKVLRIPN